MTTVAFIGLGVMGAPMSRNLLRAGYDVVGYDLNKETIHRFVADGGRGASSLAESLTGADVVASMVQDSPDVRELMLAAGGVFDSAQSGALIIDFSSIRPDVSAEVFAVGTERGYRVLDAPVSGGEQGAIDASLAIMVGGLETDFAAAKPIFEVLGKTVVHVGPPGAGQTVKAANQLIVAGTIGLVAEAMVFLEAFNVDVTSAMRVLAGGLAGNVILQRKGETMLARDFTPGFRIELHNKDMGIVTAAARQVGVVLPLSAVTAQLVASVNAQGGGKLDHTALLKLIEQLSGRRDFQHGIEASSAAVPQQAANHT
jgi:2-hydroxy-3-oxopropionate reductase